MRRLTAGRRFRPLIVIVAVSASFACFYAFAAVTAGAGSSSAPAASAPTFYRVGAASVNITPDPAADTIHLHCYGDRKRKPATGVLDPLYVRALVIADPNGKMIGLVSADLCYINSGVRDKAVEMLQPHGLGEHNLLLAGTHTHSGCAGFDRRYVATRFFGDFNQAVFDRIVLGITTALLTAQRKMQPAAVEFAAAEIEGMSRSRQDPAFNINEGGAPTGVAPDPVKYPVNKRLAVIRFTDTAGKLLAVLVNFASHATILSPKNLQISADWPGEMVRGVQKELGEDVPVLFFNGSLGDAAPPPDWAAGVETEIAQMRQYGQQMSAHVLALLPQGRPLQKEFIGGFTVRRDFSQAVLRFFFRLRLPRFISKIAYLRPDAPFQTMRLGEIVLLNIPGEPTTAVGRRLENLGAADTGALVLAPANDYLGYFVTPEEYERDTYAADSCLFGPDTATRVIEATEMARRNMEAMP